MSHPSQETMRLRGVLRRMQNPLRCAGYEHDLSADFGAHVLEELSNPTILDLQGSSSEFLGDRLWSLNVSPRV